MTYRKRKFEIVRKFMNPELIKDMRIVFARDKDKRRPDKEREIRLGQNLVALFEDLGPVFIKFGQILSTRRDIFSDDIINELEKLQDDVKEEDFSYIKEIIEEEFARDIEDIFVEFDRKVLATGSIAQTHLAYIRTDDSVKKVVVKVRRKDIEKTVSEDLSIIRDLYRKYQNKLNFIESFDLGEVLEEFGKTLRKEIDFKNEKENILKYREDNQRSSDLSSPDVYENYCGKSVLTIEYINGKTIRSSYDKDPEIRKALAKKIIKAYTNQMFSYGFFHADPHPGNIFVDSENNLYLIDFGIVSTLSENYRYQIIKIFLGASLNEVSLVTDAIIGMGLLAFDSKKIPIFERRIQKLLDKYMAMNISQLKLVELIEDFYRLLVDFSIKIPSELTNFGKTILTVEGLIEKLVPEESFIALAIPLARPMALKLLSPDIVSNRILKNTYDSASFIKELPKASLNILRQLERGDFALVQRKGEKEMDLYKKVEEKKSISLIFLAFALILSSTILALSLLGIRSKYFLIFLGLSLLISFLAIIVLLVRIFRDKNK
ncbi:MAG: AarF/UbiB family protein [Anaerococcus sp.]|uniref:ABC1 kinase family protein n=1 Tax=Anaerococcus sp. TaxID=1872515 RepID=UPI0026226BFF|nr:AarF/UbiB family protein [Anaerococcus sp.]MCI5971905.1 AarF/UbiB family protein [Anaerococcus sp.]MDD6919243.1 AarF/UbiB family protein [Peptoniphilaceae bacterium]MDY2927180.1 AarF/UbiB family protein [Anaerococcus sp.]